jgi:hypothetical protein
MAVRAFHLLGAGHLDSIRALFIQALDDWRDAWGIGCDLGDLTVEPASPTGVDTAVDWCRYWTAVATTGGVWCDWSDGLAADVARLVFPADGNRRADVDEGALARRGGEAAFDALLDRLRALCAGDGATVALLRQPDPDSVRHGSGCVCVRIGLNRAGLRLLLDAACVRRLSGRAAAAPLARLGEVSLRKVLDRVPVKLNVEAGVAEIGAGTLLTIGVGDVIALPVALDGTLSVHLPGGAELCRGYIGRRDNAFAVEIAI